MLECKGMKRMSYQRDMNNYPDHTFVPWCMARVDLTWMGNSLDETVWMENSLRTLTRGVDLQPRGHAPAVAARGQGTAGLFRQLFESGAHLKSWAVGCGLAGAFKEWHC